MPINQEKKSEITIKGNTAGQKKVVVTAENSDVEKKAVIEYQVLDSPALTMEIVAPTELSFGQTANILLDLEKTSFTTPLNVEVVLKSAGFSNTWNIETLQQKMELPIEIKDLPLTRKNKFTATIFWDDQEGKAYSLSKEVIIASKANSLGERIKMFFNGVVNFFSG